MEEKDIIICLKKRKKKLKQYRKNCHEAKKSQFSDKYFFDYTKINSLCYDLVMHWAKQYYKDEKKD